MSAEKGPRLRVVGGPDNTQPVEFSAPTPSLESIIPERVAKLLDLAASCAADSSRVKEQLWGLLYNEERSPLENLETKVNDLWLEIRRLDVLCVDYGSRSPSEPKRRQKPRTGDSSCT